MAAPDGGDAPPAEAREGDSALDLGEGARANVEFWMGREGACPGRLDMAWRCSEVDVVVEPGHFVEDGGVHFG